MGDDKESRSVIVCKALTRRSLESLESTCQMTGGYEMCVAKDAKS